MPEQITINVSIDPSVEPYVDAVLDKVESAIDSMDVLWPHLGGAFSSLSNGWQYLTEQQRETLLERSPRLTRANNLRERLNRLLNEIPDLGGGI